MRRRKLALIALPLLPHWCFSLYYWWVRWQFVQCHNVDDYNEFDNLELLLLFTQLGYGQISDMTTMLSAEFQKRSNFCVKDPLDADWNQAFNLSFNLDFFASCIQKLKSATPLGTALMMLDANKMVATASSCNPTLASAMTRLQRCALVAVEV
ncbi:ABC transporter G family member 24 [Vitis vinifera]|uniref:ABC transporter G family member 24 n=1 Tax=Vitis vinifera TaxID=29760 RepID=A0A438GU87_VITVI|nr:ABC transporter G family member 24 [Vitis vinifera]